MRPISPFLEIRAATWVGPDRYETGNDAHGFARCAGYVAGKLRMGRAVADALELGMEATWVRIDRQAARLRSLLTEIPDVGARSRAGQGRNRHLHGRGGAGAGRLRVLGGRLDRHQRLVGRRRAVRHGGAGSDADRAGVP